MIEAMSRWQVSPARETLPPNHLPKGFTQVSAIPRTGSGKIARRELQALAAKRA